MSASQYDLRIARADHLATQYPFAAQALNFFKAVTVEQARLHEDVARRSPALGDAANLRRGILPAPEMIGRFPEFLSHLEAVSPEPLAESARALSERSQEDWQELFALCWDSTFQPPAAASDRALGRMFLQPFAEFLSKHSVVQQDSPSACPFCFEKPVVGVLRPEGDGGKRSLICSMCSYEWQCNRIVCAACGEQNVEKLAVYSTEQFPHVRIDACDTCRYYIKTIDLTKTGRAIPIVDEIATLPLSLWASGRNYQKVQTNLLGL
jgi:formate dehydrogenase accessory protein FdhE